ncbi:MAG: hypothetical protein J7K22_00225, partial [Nanoarchaeota archaeon]|nr:hypothetical protein [Nanoarchaeota archaeon]
KGGMLNINALLEEETGELEDLIEGWKIDRDKGIISNGKDTYEYLELEKFGDWYKVMNHNGEGFILPNTPDVFRVNEEQENYAILEKEGKKFVANLEGKVLSSEYNDVLKLQIEDGVAYFEAREGDKWRVVRLDGGEVKSGLYDWVDILKVKDGVAYFEAREGDKQRVVRLDGGEVKSGLYNSIWNFQVKDGVAYYATKDGDKERVIKFNGVQEKKSSLYDKIELLWGLKIVSGVVGFVAKEGKKQKAVLFDGEKEVESLRLYDEIKLSDIFQEGNKIIMEFNGAKNDLWIKDSIEYELS